MDVHAMRGDQLCLRVVQDQPQRGQQPVQVRRHGQCRRIEQELEVVGAGEAREDHGRQGDGGDDREAITDDGVHGIAKLFRPAEGTMKGRLNAAYFSLTGLMITASD